MRFILVILQIVVAGVAVAQEPLPAPLRDIGAALSGQQPVPPALGAYLKTWVEPAEPFRIVGPIYYVGTKGLAAYLITTPAGHFLLDGGMPDSAEVFEESIHKLGFDPRDIKFLLITHAHIDHAGTMGHFVRLSGGSAVVMDRDLELLKSGGKIDPAYGKHPAFHFPPVTAERVLKDWDVLTLGNIKMTALLGAGHTRGAKQGCHLYVAERENVPIFQDALGRDRGGSEMRGVFHRQDRSFRRISAARDHDPSRRPNRPTAARNAPSCPHDRCGRG